MWFIRGKDFGPHPHWTLLTFGPIILQSTFNTAIASFPIDSFMIDDWDWAIIFGTSSRDFTAQFRRLIFPMKYVVFQTDGFRSSMVHLFDIDLATPQLISIESKDFCVRKNLIYHFPELWSNAVLSGGQQEEYGEIPRKYERNSGEMWAAEILEEGPWLTWRISSGAVRRTAGDKQTKLKVGDNRRIYSTRSNATLQNHCTFV